MNKTVPEAPSPDPCDNRVASAPVGIKTMQGEWHTARWVVYRDPEIGSVWELADGRTQFEWDEVLDWVDLDRLTDEFLPYFPEGTSREVLRRALRPTFY